MDFVCQYMAFSVPYSLEFSDRPFSTCFTRLDILIPYVCPNPSSKVINYPVPKHTGELLVSLVGLSNH